MTTTCITCTPGIDVNGHLRCVICSAHLTLAYAKQAFKKLYPHDWEEAYLELKYAKRRYRRS
jgi:hypothetical protein